MQNIVLLLQLVLALMQASPNNAQVQLLAQQAVSLATTQIASFEETSVGAQFAPTSIPVTQAEQLPTRNELTQAPVMGNVTPLNIDSCNIFAVLSGGTSTPITTITWSLSGIPTSTVGTISSIGGSVNSSTFSGNYAIMPGFYHLQYQDSGPFPDQLETNISEYFPGGVHADFGNGVTCDYPMVN